MQVLQNANIPFLIAGADALRFYTGVSRQTKDFDLHLRPAHVGAALDAFARAGYKTKKYFHIGWPKPNVVAIALI